MSVEATMGAVGQSPSNFEPTEEAERLSRASRTGRALLSDPTLFAGVAILALLVLFAIFAPILWGHNPDKQNLLIALEPPSPAHPMGTDQLGRDVFARVAYGARISLFVSIGVAVLGGLIGGAMGLVAGTVGGWSDSALMRTMDAILAFPPLVLAIAVASSLGAGVSTAAIGIAIVSIPWYVRLIRSEALRVRSLAFVEAAHALGATRKRIILRHVMPHLLPVLLIQMAACFGYAVLALAGLSFLGLGAQVPTPEWGAMITEGLGSALTGQWWIAVFPGVAVCITVTGASMLSDRMRDLLDPRGSYARL